MSVKKTIATYNRIAEDYTQRWQDRSVMANQVERFLSAVSAGGMVLDVGCGPGFDCALLREHDLRVLGLDLSWGMLQIARSRYAGHYVQADMRHLPVRHSVDGIWCSAALLHLSRRDAARALREFRRVLFPGGVLFLAVKEGQGEAQRSEAYGPHAPRYFTYWQEDELDQVLEESGFGVLHSWINDLDEQRWLCRLAC